MEESPYNDPSAVATDTQSDWSLDSILNLGQKAVTLYGSIKSQVSGSPVAVPINNPAPNSPIGRDAALPPPPPAASWFDVQASKMGVSVSLIYGAVAVAGLAVLFVVMKIFKGK